MPSGRLLSWLLNRLSEVSPVIPEKSSVFSAVMPALRKLRSVIAARCAAVTLAVPLTFGIALTIAACTSGVRALTGIIGISLTSVTLMVTVMLSLPSLPSEALTVTE